MTSRSDLTDEQVAALAAVDWHHHPTCECICAGVYCGRPARHILTEHAPCGRLFYSCTPCLEEMRERFAEGDRCDRCGVTFYVFDVAFPGVVAI